MKLNVKINSTSHFGAASGVIDHIRMVSSCDAVNACFPPAVLLLLHATLLTGAVRDLSKKIDHEEHWWNQYGR